jgi:hypothetical protein
MASGVSRSTGTSAYLREDNSGLILHQNSPEEIGSALGRLIIDPKLRQTLAIGARQLYGQMFTQKAFDAKYISRSRAAVKRQNSTDGL